MTETPPSPRAPLHFDFYISSLIDIVAYYKCSRAQNSALLNRAMGLIYTFLAKRRHLNGWNDTNVVVDEIRED